MRPKWLKAKYSIPEVMALVGLSRFQVYRLKKRCKSPGKYLWVSRLRDHMPEVYDSLSLVLSHHDTE